MSSLAQAIGKGLRGAAAVAVPMAFEEQKRQIEAERDARLQSYAEKNLANQQQFQTSERQATEQFTATQNASRNAIDAGRLGQETRRNDIDESRQGDLHAQSQAAIKQINQQLQIGDITLADAKRLEGVREEITGAKTADELNAAVSKYNALQGKNEMEWEKATDYGPMDDQGHQEKQDYLYSKRTGQRKDDPAAALSRLTGDPSKVPQQAITDVINNPALKQQFETKYKVSFDAVKNMQPQGAAANKVSSEDAAKQITSPVNPSGSSAPAADQAQDPLAGFSNEAPESSGVKAIKSVVGSLSQARSQKAAPVEQQKSADAAKAVKEVIASKNLFDLAKLRAFGDVDRAMNSGLLSDQELTIVRAWLAKQK